MSSYFTLGHAARDNLEELQSTSFLIYYSENFLVWTLITPNMFTTMVFFSNTYTATSGVPQGSN